MVNAIPEGTHTITPHLVIRGAAGAIEFYKRAFGAIEIMRMPGPGGALMHAELQIGDSRLYLADEMPGMGASSPQALKGSPVTINLYVPDCDAVFASAVKAGAKVTMPLADQFWGDRYGQVDDPFGHRWSISTHKEDLTPEETGRRAEAFFASMPPPPKPAAKTPAAKPAQKATGSKPKAPLKPAKKAGKGKKRR